jgi:hypothetical protein
MVIEMYTPVIDDQRVEIASMAPRLSTLKNSRIGLLSNGKHNADVLIQMTADLFIEDHGGEVVLELNKGNASRPCPDDLVDTVVKADVDFMITAVGD